MDRGGGPGLDAAVIAVDGLLPGDLGVLEADGFLLGGEQFDILAQGALIAFERQHVIGLHGEDFLGDVALAADRVDGDDGALDRQQVEQLGDGDDLVRLVRHLDLAEHQALMRGKGRHHMDRRLGALLPAGAAQRLAVDGDHLLGRAGQRRHPIDEAALELLGIEHRKNVTEVIMGGRPMAKRPKPAQQRDLLFPKPRNVDECLRPRQHRQQAQQQHFGQRIDHLAGLARVRQILEIIQENNRLAKRRQVRTRPLHRSSSASESEDHDRFST